MEVEKNDVLKPDGNNGLANQEGAVVVHPTKTDETVYVDETFYNMVFVSSNISRLPERDGYMDRGGLLFHGTEEEYGFYVVPSVSVIDENLPDMDFENLKLYWDKAHTFLAEQVDLLCSNGDIKYILPDPKSKGEFSYNWDNSGYDSVVRDYLFNGIEPHNPYEKLPLLSFWFCYNKNDSYVTFGIAGIVDQVLNLQNNFKAYVHGVVNAIGGSEARNLFNNLKTVRIVYDGSLAQKFLSCVSLNGILRPYGGDGESLKNLTVGEYREGLHVTYAEIGELFTDLSRYIKDYDTLALLKYIYTTQNELGKAFGDFLNYIGTAEKKTITGNLKPDKGPASDIKEALEKIASKIKKIHRIALDIKKFTDDKDKYKGKKLLRKSVDIVANVRGGLAIRQQYTVANDKEQRAKLNGKINKVSVPKGYMDIDGFDNKTWRNQTIDSYIVGKSLVVDFKLSQRMNTVSVNMDCSLILHECQNYNLEKRETRIYFKHVLLRIGGLILPLSQSDREDLPFYIAEYIHSTKDENSTKDVNGTTFSAVKVQFRPTIKPGSFNTARFGNQADLLWNKFFSYALSCTFFLNTRFFVFQNLFVGEIRKENYSLSITTDKLGYKEGGYFTLDLTNYMNISVNTEEKDEPAKDEPAKGENDDPLVERVLNREELKDVLANFKTLEDFDYVYNGQEPESGAEVPLDMEIEDVNDIRNIMAFGSLYGASLNSRKKRDASKPKKELKDNRKD